MSLVLGACATTSPERKSNEVFVNDLRPQLEAFVKAGAPNRGVGRPGHDAAFEYLKTKFAELAAKAGGKVIIHNFTPDIDFAVKNYKVDFDTQVKTKFKPTAPEYKKWKAFTDGAVAFVEKYRGIPGKNLILELPGKRNPDTVVYVGAHYDTITHDHDTLKFTPDTPTEGADGNASGVTALLAIARALSSKPHDHTIRLVAFDYEEIFFLGSYALAKDMNSQSQRWMKPEEKNLGLLNLEMIGWSTYKLANHPVVKLYTRLPSESGYDSDMRLAQYFVRSALKTQSSLAPKIVANGFNRSDNWSFWQLSFPSVCVSEDWEDDFNKNNYHTSHDSASTLNYDYLREVTLVAIETADKLARDDMHMSFEQ